MNSPIWAITYCSIPLVERPGVFSCIKQIKWTKSYIRRKDSSIGIFYLSSRPTLGLNLSISPMKIWARVIYAGFVINFEGVPNSQPYSSIISFNSFNNDSVFLFSLINFIVYSSTVNLSFSASILLLNYLFPLSSMISSANRSPSSTQAAKTPSNMLILSFWFFWKL